MIFHVVEWSSQTTIFQWKAITMDCQDYTAVKAEHKKGQHLGAEERDAIKALVKQGLGIWAVARDIGCAPSTVTNELRRGSAENFVYSPNAR